MLTGAVSAASMWGSYKGNDIIRITSNGYPLKSGDVPAISYNGRTMIPINMLGQVGLQYSWNQSNKTVDITTNTNNASSSTLMSADSIKINVKYADFFNQLKTFGDSLTALSGTYSLAYNESYIKHTTTYFTTANSHLNGAIDDYNNLLALSKNYTDNNISNILTDYYTSIDHYKSMDTNLSNFFKSNSQSDFDAYLDGSKNGFNYSFNGKKKSIDSYNKYISLALNN